MLYGGLMVVNNYYVFILGVGWNICIGVIFVDVIKLYSK